MAELRIGAGRRWGDLLLPLTQDRDDLGNTWDPQASGGGSEKADLGSHPSSHHVLALVSLSLVFIFCEVGALLPRKVWGRNLRTVRNTLENQNGHHGEGARLWSSLTLPFSLPLSLLPTLLPASPVSLCIEYSTREKRVEENLALNLSPTGVTLPSGRGRVVSEALGPSTLMSVLPALPGAAALLKGALARHRKGGPWEGLSPRMGVYVCARVSVLHTCLHESVCLRYVCACVRVSVHACTLEFICGCTCMHAYVWACASVSASLRGGTLWSSCAWFR